MGYLKGNIPWNKGQKTGLIPKTAFKKGHIPPLKGKYGIHISQETEFKKQDPRITGEINHLWKGDKAGYYAIHSWVQEYKPKSDFCCSCGRQNCRLELSNISGEYKRDINDYEWLCVRCHRKKDLGKPKDLLELNWKRRIEKDGKTNN